MVLPADGAVSEPVKTEDGWALVLRTAERPAVTRTMEQLRPVLEARIRMRRKGEAREQAVKKLKEAAGIVIAEGALDTVRAPEEVTRPDRGANP